MTTRIRAILTGATGMVGEGVLHECLLHPEVESVLVIGRKPCGVVHPKLNEIILSDFFNLESIGSQLTGYNACFFCLGVSSLGMKEPEYTRISYDLTMNVAKILCRLNPDMTFCYVSGSGTDSTEKGRMMWARVKGKTENELLKLPFRAAYNFRPAFMLPTKGLRNALSFYKYVTWLYPVVHPLFPGSFGTLRDLGLAMINCVLFGCEKKVLDSKEIAAMAMKK
jgi:hypothetical protein